MQPSVAQNPFAPVVPHRQSDARSSLTRDHDFVLLSDVICVVMRRTHKTIGVTQSGRRSAMEAAVFDVNINFWRSS